MTTKARILVVDDHEISRLLLFAVLEGAGYEVIGANDGAAGLRAFLEHRPDVVITDVFMPVKDGVRLIGDLRRAAPETKIIAVSAGWRISRLEVAPRLEEGDVLKDALEAGADVAMTKPLDTEVVLGTVATLLGRAG